MPRIQFLLSSYCRSPRTSSGVCTYQPYCSILLISSFTVLHLDLLKVILAPLLLF